MPSDRIGAFDRFVLEFTVCMRYSRWLRFGPLYEGVLECTTCVTSIDEECQGVNLPSLLRRRAPRLCEVDQIPEWSRPQRSRHVLGLLRFLRAHSIDCEHQIMPPTRH